MVSVSSMTLRGLTGKVKITPSVKIGSSAGIDGVG
jgi:hypothetical protein